MQHRRGFLRSLATAAVVPSVLQYTAKPVLASEVAPVGSSYTPSILPGALGPGSTIGIASPASGVTSREIRDFVDICTGLQIDVRYGRNLSKHNGYLSASDDERAGEFMDFISDPSVDAIVCGRGGYGVMRILPLLDYNAIREAGKVIMGFSDITALLIAIHQLSGLVTFHGPVASSTFDDFTLEAMKTLLMAEKITKHNSTLTTASDSKAIYTFSDERVTVIHGGLGKGRLTGGNLATVVSTLGTRYEIDTTNAILFLEETNEEPYKIDRMLTQLWLAGKLQQCNGIALGNFRNCEARGPSFSSPSSSLTKVLEHCTSNLGIPVVYGLPFGHVRSKMTLPIGVNAELDASKKKLSILHTAVA